MHWECFYVRLQMEMNSQLCVGCTLIGSFSQSAMIRASWMTSRRNINNISLLKYWNVISEGDDSWAYILKPHCSTTSQRGGLRKSTSGICRILDRGEDIAKGDACITKITEHSLGSHVTCSITTTKTSGMYSIQLIHQWVFIGKKTRDALLSW